MRIDYRYATSCQTFSKCDFWGKLLTRTWLNLKDQPPESVGPKRKHTAILSTFLTEVHGLERSPPHPCQLRKDTKTSKNVLFEESLNIEKNKNLNYSREKEHLEMFAG